MPSDQKLRRQLAETIRQLLYEGQQWRPALLGKPTGVSTWTYDPPGFTGWKYVRIIQADGGVSLTRALNTAGVSDVGDTALWVALNIENQLEIVRLRAQGFT
jgi:hypothetical protein